MIATMSGNQDTEAARQDRHKQAVANIVATVLGMRIPGPAGPLVAAAVMPVFEYWAGKVFDEVTGDGRRRGGELIESACETADLPVEEVARLIQSSDQTRLLAGLALAAASRTAWDHKVRTLGRSLAAGLLADDTAQVDTEQLILSAIADIEAPHLSMLELLVCHQPAEMDFAVFYGLGSLQLDIPDYSYQFGRNGRWWSAGLRRWSIYQIKHERPRLIPLSSSLLGTIQRHGLAVLNSNVDEYLFEAIEQLEEARRTDGMRVQPGLKPSLASSVSHVGVTSTWSPTELGEQVLLRFREAGTDVPDAWMSPSDGVGGANFGISG